MNNKSYSKMAAILALVLVIAGSLWFALPATPSYAQGGYQTRGDGGAGEPHPGFTSLRDNIDIRGVLTSDVTVKSPDKLCQLTINKNTKALNKSRDPLGGIIIVEMKEPPAPPPNANVLSPTYDLEPDGATFDPPITITLTYDPAVILLGIAEENLVIARWDKEVGGWVNLISTVDPVTNTVSTPASHFTAFTVIAFTRPAAFATSTLTISPTEADIGESITISITVTNTGDLTGTHEVTLKIDNVVVATKDVTLAGQASQEVTFTTTKDAAGSYTVNVDGLSGTFTVKPAPPPTPPAPPPAPTPPAPAPPAPTPPAPAPPAPAPAPAPLPAPAPTPTAVNWWLIGSIIAGLTTIGAVVWLVGARRRTDKA